MASGTRSKIVPKFARDRKIWERQPGETDKAWAAFLFYRELGPERSIAAASQIYRDKYGKKSKQSSTERTFHEWSRHGGWRIRIEEWERHTDKARQKAAVDEIKRMAIRHARIGRSVQGLSALEIQKQIEKSKRIPKPIMPPLEAVRIAEAGIKIELHAAGEPTDTVENRHAFGDTRDRLRVLLGDTAAMQAIDTLLGKLGPEPDQDRAPETTESNVEGE